ncbi:MAG: asparagine synthase (glutamine-hydrolyzing) [Anaerolineales bacterium]
MCGICGIFPRDGAPPDEAALRRMTAALVHRGPDSDGYHLDAAGGPALGFRRLAIIDLHSGDQPMYNEDRTVVTVFNGEIYNYKTLRAELENAGHVFRSRADTEVLVHGYEEWGVALLDRLRGMYAFAIWDATARRLLLTRDRMGQKPLYYAEHAGAWVFASEAKALLTLPGFAARVNEAAVPEYLTLGYVLPPRTLFAGIHKLPPGHLMQIEADGAPHIREYWAPSLDPAPDLTRQIGAHAVRQALTEAVDMRLMSDVPLGAFLSGGVDSTAITALMARATGAPVRTFTVGFDFRRHSPGDQKFNVDLHHAAEAARALGCEHHAIVLAHDASLAGLLPQLVYALDEPISDPAIMQTVTVTALARATGVPVILSGDGADEIFAGYAFFEAARRVQRYTKRIPAAVRHGVIEPGIGLLGHGGRLEVLHKLREKANLPTPADHFLSWDAVNADAARWLADPRHVADAHAALRAQINALLEPLDTPELADRVGYARLRLWLAENSNTRFDKLSMWMSVEARSPFQDHELVDLGLSLPLGIKLAETSKAVLKDAVGDLLPEAVLKRPKWGFMPPASDWLRGPLRPLLDTYCSPARLRATGFDPQAVRPLIEAHLARRGYHLHEIWALLMFQLWHAMFITGDLTIQPRWSADDLVARLTTT